jgi:hypothetical protein
LFEVLFFVFYERQDVTNTPGKQRRRPRTPSSSVQRPNSAGSQSQSAKRGRPNTAESLQTPRPLTPTPPKTTKETIADLRAEIEADLVEQERLEKSIKTSVQKIRQLRQLEKKVLRADALQKKIQENVKEMSRLDRKPYDIKDGSSVTQMQYYLNELDVGKMDIFKDRGIMFLSELEEGIFHKVEPPEEANPPIEEESESEEVQEESQPSIKVVAQMAVEVDPKPSIVIEGETDDSNAGKGKRKRKPHRAKSKT